MFDRITLKAPDTYINVKQQPNDAADAARLHQEIRDRAQSEARTAILDRLGADNEIRVVKTHGERSFERMDIRVRALFRINGVAYQVDITEDDARGLDDAIRERIAHLIMMDIMRMLKP